MHLCVTFSTIKCLYHAVNNNNSADAKINGSQLGTPNTTTSTSTPTTVKTATPKVMATPPTVKLSLFDLDIPDPEPLKVSPPTPSTASSATPTTTVPLVTLSLTSLTESVTDDVDVVVDKLTAVSISAAPANVNGVSEGQGDAEDWENWNDTVVPSLPPPSTSPAGPSKPTRRGRGGSKFNEEEKTDLGSIDYDLPGVQQISGGGASSRSAPSAKEHILEIYNIPPTCKTSDLENLLEEYRNLVRFKWVNDTAALAIFRTVLFANEALVTVTHPTMKLRLLADAPEESRHKAMINPPLSSTTTTTPRPYKTTTTVARRLIANALQMPELGAGRTTEDDTRDAKRRVWDE